MIVGSGSEVLEISVGLAIKSRLSTPISEIFAVKRNLGNPKYDVCDMCTAVNVGDGGGWSS